MYGSKQETEKEGHNCYYCGPVSGFQTRTSPLRPWYCLTFFYNLLGIGVSPIPNNRTVSDYGVLGTISIAIDKNPVDKIFSGTFWHNLSDQNQVSTVVLTKGKFLFISRVCFNKVSHSLVNVWLTFTSQHVTLFTFLCFFVLT